MIASRRKEVKSKALVLTVQIADVFHYLFKELTNVFENYFSVLAKQ